MANLGISPLEPTTPVGQFRLLIGDTTSVPLEPPVAGFGNYKLFSDAEIEVFLAGSESPEGAAYLAFMQLSGAAAMESRTIKDLDLQVDLTKRATDLRLIAAEWKNRADALSADIFELFSPESDCGCVPEATPRQVCRRGCSGIRFF